MSGSPDRTSLGCASLLALLWLGGCAPTQQTFEARPAGFLGDYSQLEPGGEGSPLLVYVAPDADFSPYDRALVDPVTLWRAQDGSLAEVPAQDLQRLADHLEAKLRLHLGQEFQLVERPQPGTLRVRVALTEAVGSDVALDIASTVLPPALLASEVQRLATGTHAFVGRAAIEVEIQDALTGRRLAAAVDERAGGKTFETDTWGAVESAFDTWADELQTALGAFRRLDRADDDALPSAAP